MGRAAAPAEERTCGFYKRISGSSNKSTQRQQAEIIATGHAFPQSFFLSKPTFRYPNFN